jgi:hypothetical protein
MTIIIVAALCLAGVLCAFLVLTPRLVGNVIIAEGGVMSSLEIMQETGALHWVGVYGNLTPNGTEGQVGLVGGALLPLDLSYGIFTDETLVIAATTPTPAWEGLVPASRAQVDAYIGLDGSDEESAVHTFTEQRNVTVGNVVHLAWSVQTLSTSGEYVTGAFIADGELVFITAPVLLGRGFDGSFTDYQILIPLPPAGTADYSFFVLEQGEVTGGNASLLCAQTLGLSATVADDNTSVELAWDQVAGATGYDLLSVDGPVEGWIDLSGATVVPLGATRNWTDADPATERYYQVRIIGPSGSCVSSEKAGTMALDLSPEYNLFSTPFISVNQSIVQTLKGVAGQYTTVYEFDNQQKTYSFYAIVGNNIFKNFDTIQPGKGYWIKTTGNGTLRLAGLLSANTTDALPPDYNLVGFPVIDNPDHNATLSFVLSSIDGQYTTVYEFDNQQKTYSFYAIVGNNIFKNFDTIKPGKGYWIKTTTTASLNYTNG